MAPVRHLANGADYGFVIHDSLLKNINGAAIFTLI